MIKIDFFVSEWEDIKLEMLSYWLNLRKKRIWCVYEGDEEDEGWEGRGDIG